MKDLKRALFLSLSLALSLAACSGGHRRQVNLLEHKSQAAERPVYVEPGQFVSAVFPPPPVPGSAEDQADLAAVLAWQNRRTEEDCARARRTADETYDSFWGQRSLFAEPLPAEVKEFFERLAGDLEASLNGMKKRYSRPRPFHAHPEDAQPCIKRSKSFSYPSGHSTFSRVFANVLSELAPQRREEFFAKADAIAQDRVVGGVHYPADIAAGKRFGDLYYAELSRSPEYRKDLEKLRALLKP